MRFLKIKQKPAKIALIAVFLLAFYSLVYSDILITVQNSVNLIEFISQGRLGDFYSQSYGAVVNLGFNTGDTVFYDFPLYIVFAVWNFPLWIAQHFFGVRLFYSPLCVMWAKSLLLVFTLLALWALDGICREMNMSEEDADLCQLLFITGGFFVNAVCLLSQYDIISISLMLLGIRAYFKNDTKKFLLFFALSVPMKLFTLLAFVPLVLLKTKHVGHIMLQGLVSVSFLVICRLLLSATTRSDGLFWFLFRSYIGMGVGKLYFFFAVLLLVFLVCYIRPYTDDDAQKQWAVYMCLCSYCTFFAFSNNYPYWSIFMAPFICLLVAKHRDILRVNLLLDLVLSYGLILAYIFTFNWCYSGADCSSMLLSFLQGGQPLNVQDPSSLVLMLMPGHENAFEYIVGLGISAFAAGLLLFLVVNNPFATKRLPLLKTADGDNESFFMGLRVAAALGLCLIPMVCYAAGLCGVMGIVAVG